MGFRNAAATFKQTHPHLNPPLEGEDFKAKARGFRSMSDTTSLLIELGTEELPVKALPGLAQALFDGVIDALGKRGIAVERGEAKPLYSPRRLAVRSEEPTSELQSLMRISYAVFCLKKKKQKRQHNI